MTAPVTDLSLPPAALVAIIAPWGEVAEPIHRRIARLTDGGADRETLWIGCGYGRSVLWWAERHGAPIEGLDPNAEAIDASERAARAAGLKTRITFQHGRPDDLPHEAQVFDLTVVNALQLSGTDGASAVQQAARVTRPMGMLVGILPVWLQTPTDDDRTQLAALGIHPLLLVEWKSLLKEAGIVEVTVEEAASDAGWIAPGWFGILVRAWRLRKWRGLRAVLRRPFRSFRRLVLHRVVGLSLVRGTRWPA